MPILGIDLGAQSTVLATIGRNGLTVVRNDLAERLTPTVVGYTDKERLLGDAAVSLLKSNAKNTARFFKHTLGLTPDVPNAAAVIEREQQFALAQIVQTASGFTGYNVGRKEPVTSCELLAGFLTKLRNIGENYIGAEITGVTVAVPLWFTDTSRQAVKDACEIVGLDCLKIINHSTATALDYGLFRSSQFDAANDHTVCFVDIGHGAATVTVAKFKPAEVTIVDAFEDPSLGGRAIDRLIVAHLAAIGQRLYGIDASKNPRGLLRLEEAAEKAKRVLSANREAHINIECICEDNDLNLKISREEFETMCADYLTKLQQLLQQALTTIKDPATLVAVEICGGCTRIPCIQTTLENTFSKPLSRTVSADECVARGAAIQAAMLDHRYKVKPMKINDGRSTPILLSSDTPKLIEQLRDGNPASPPPQPLNPSGPNTVVLFPAKTENNASRTLWLDSAKDFTEIRFKLFAHHQKLGQQEELGLYSLTIDEKFRARASDKRLVKLRLGFGLDIDGFTQCDAVIVEEITEQEKYMDKVPKLDEEGKPIENEFDEIEKVRDNLRTKRTPLCLNVSRPSSWLNFEQVQGLKEKERSLQEEDHQAQEARRVRNEILSTCFKLRDALNANGSHVQYATEEEKAKIVEESNKAELWVEDNGDLSLAEYQPVYDKLMAIWEPVDCRFRDAAEKLRKQDEEKAAQDAAVKSEEAAKNEVAANDSQNGSPSEQNEMNDDTPPAAKEEKSGTA